MGALGEREPTEERRGMGVANPDVLRGWASWVSAVIRSIKMATFGVGGVNDNGR